MDNTGGMGGDRIKLTISVIGEWDEKRNYASDILFEWSHD